MIARCRNKSVVRVGQPYQEIVQLAIEAHFDLIVLSIRAAMRWMGHYSAPHEVQPRKLGSCRYLPDSLSHRAVKSLFGPATSGRSRPAQI
jgi:hypothetical protein